MSSRALRKAQREREEQDRLNKVEDDAISDDDVVQKPAAKSAFAMLGEDNDEDEDEDAKEDNDNSDDADEQQKPEAVESITKPAAKKKKKKKKAKAPPPPANNGFEEMDEIDKALKELRMNGSSLPGTTVAGVNQESDETSKLLAIETTHLQAQNEMRRLFGRAALEQQDDDEGAVEGNVGGNRRQQRRVQQMGLAQALRGQQPGARQGGLAAMALRRNIFVQGKEEWPNATGGGLGMEVEERRADGTVLYRFVHNTMYEDVQHQFSIAVESMDPNRLVVLLQQNPYHIATLLQVSEIAKQDRNHAVSGDLLERALFSFGRAVHSTFSKTLMAGKARLDFRRPQNREFWLASWRYMQNLSMRATWRTVYEWAKLLLQLSPGYDPYAMWLVLDQYALRSRQDLDFLNLSRSPIFKSHLETMPNVQLSQGLAEWRAGNKSKGQQALFKAVGRFPWVVFRLMQELNIDAPPAIWGKEARTDKEKLQAEMYATRAKDLWGTPEASALLIEVASAVSPDTVIPEPDADSFIDEDEARHVMLSDTPALIALIPRHFTARVQSSSDPLPPEDTYETQHAPRGLGQRPSGVDRSSALEQLAELESWFDEAVPGFELSDENVTSQLVQRAAQYHSVQPEEVMRKLMQLVQLQLSLHGLPQAPEVSFEESDDNESDSPPGLQARVEDAHEED